MLVGIGHVYIYSLSDPLTKHIPWNKSKPGYTTKKSKPVLQLDLSENVLNEYKNCKQAGEVFGCDPEAIRNACSGHSKTSQGYKWKYK